MFVRCACMLINFSSLGITPLSFPQLLQTMLPTCAPRDCSDAKLAENQTKNRTDAVLPRMSSYTVTVVLLC